MGDQRSAMTLGNKEVWHQWEVCLCARVCYTAGIQHLEPVSSLVTAARVNAVGGQFPPLPVVSPLCFNIPTVHILASTRHHPRGTEGHAHGTILGDKTTRKALLC